VRGEGVDRIGTFCSRSGFVPMIDISISVVSFVTVLHVCAGTLQLYSLKHKILDHMTIHRLERDLGLHGRGEMNISWRLCPPKNHSTKHGRRGGLDLRDGPVAAVVRCEGVTQDSHVLQPLRVRAHA
jgi:hypothetical protein